MHTKVTANAQAMKRWLGKAETALGNHSDRLNAINIFPVADGDTGTNLYLTVRAAARSLANDDASAAQADVGEVLAVAGRAFQVAHWARTHRFCGVCGAPMTRAAGERAMKCACGHTAYPRISPAMMVLVRRGDHILLARKVAVRAGGRMSALAGFLEPGESIEEAIHREVLEEVGLRVKDLRYFASQSWPFPHALMIAFTAEYAGGELACDPTEIAEARWFGPGDTLPELSPPQSISRALIDANLP